MTKRVNYLRTAALVSYLRDDNQVGTSFDRVLRHFYVTEEAAKRAYQRAVKRGLIPLLKQSNNKAAINRGVKKAQEYRAGAATRLLNYKMEQQEVNRRIRIRQFWFRLALPYRLFKSALKFSGIT